MSDATERFYRRARKVLSREAELPDFFVYHLTVEMGQPAATVQAIKDCYAVCDLSAPSWLAPTSQTACDQSRSGS
jgi:hypothetical protein